MRGNPFSWRRAATLTNYAFGFLDYFLFLFAFLYPEVYEGDSSSHWEILLLRKSSVKIPWPPWMFQGKNPGHLVPSVIYPSQGYLDHTNTWTYWIHRWNLNAVLVFYSLLETVWYGLQSSRQALHTRVIVTACVWDVEYVQGSFMVAGVVQFLHS